jgi:hypothetical protein
VARPPRSAPRRHVLAALRVARRLLAGTRPAGSGSFASVAERARQPILEVRESREARFVLTPEASFFVPGEIPAGRPQERRSFWLASMRGEFLGRPIVTIPPEEAG